jgi:hypothetical protein
MALLATVGAAVAVQWGRLELGQLSPLASVIMIGSTTLGVSVLLLTALAALQSIPAFSALLTLAAWMLMFFFPTDWFRSAGPIGVAVAAAISVTISVPLLLVLYRMREAGAPPLTATLARLQSVMTRQFVGGAVTPSAYPLRPSASGRMAWAAQVRHVFARNLADTQVTLAVVIVALTVVATRTVLGVADDFWFDTLSDYGLRLAILFHLASVVQSDPPPTPNSFWATQPREPSAVATAKLLHGVLVLIMLVIAMLIVQGEWHVSGAPRWSDLVVSLTRFVAIVLPVLFIATMYTEASMGRFGAAMLCVSYGNVASMSSESAFELALIRASDVLTIWVWIPLSVGIAALVFWRYRHAEQLRAATGVLGLLLVLSPFALLSRGSGPPPLQVATSSTAPALSMTVVPDDDYLRFELHAPRGLPGDLYRLTNWAMIVTRKNGSTVRLDGFDDVLERRDGRTAAVRLAGDSLPVIGGEFMRMDDSASFRTLVGAHGRITNDDLAGIVVARLEGTIQSYRVNEVDRFPLQNGLAFLKDGRRAALSVTAPDTAGPRISLRTKWLGHSVARRSAWPVAYRLDSQHLSFALINNARGTMLPLRSDSDGWIGTSRQQLGFGASAYNFTLRPRIWTLPKPPVDSAWLAGAELVVGAPVPTSAVRIAVNGVVDQPVLPRRRRVR